VKLLRLSKLFGRGKEWQEEIESHVAMRAEWNERLGELPAARARAEAERQFGSTLRTYEGMREVHIARWMDDLARDIRHAARIFLRSPSVSVAAIATMAVGVGAATAVFSIVDPLLFRPLPYSHGEQLASIGVSGPIDNNEFVVGGMYLDWRDHQTVFQALTFTRPAGRCDLGETVPLRVHCIAVAGNFLDVLGVTPFLGRAFTREEDRPRAPKTTLLSYGLWRSTFGSQPSILGKKVDLDGEPVRVIGVLPPNFLMPQAGDVDLLMPAQLDEVEARAPNRTLFIRAFARLKPGISIDEAKERLVPLFQRALSGVPKELRKEVRLVVRSVRDRQIRDAKLGSWMLLGTVFLLLLMVCTNIASLLLAQVTVRENELALRAALGAGRGRLIRQSLTESLLLGTLGGALGCVASYVFLRALVLLAPGGFLRLEEARIDGRVLLFSVSVSLLCALVFGLAPALDCPRSEALKGDRATGSRRTHVRNALVTSQVAVSVTLLAGAALFARSFRELELQAIGFQPQRLIAASIVLSPRHYTEPDRLDAMYDQLESHFSGIPGVSSFAFSDTMPPSGGMHARPFSNLRIAGHSPLPQDGGMVAFRYVTPSYFQTLGIRLFQGRGFREEERNENEASLILSDTLAKRMFGKENPIGQRISLEMDQNWLTVVGIAVDVKNSGLMADTSPEYYRLRTRHSRQVGNTAVALFRTSLPLATLRQQVKKEIAALDPATPVEMLAMDERVRSLNDRPRFLAMIVGIFATTGLLLAGVGLYGVMSFLVASRTREIGVRTALGATRRDIALLIHRRAGMLVACGILIGTGGSLFLTRLIQALLFGVSPYDPFSLGAPILVLAAVGLMAAWRPSRTAAKIDPAIALRVT
jgi:putative ABC transport system permease protein